MNVTKFANRKAEDILLLTTENTDTLTKHTKTTPQKALGNEIGIIVEALLFTAPFENGRKSFLVRIN